MSTEVTLAAAAVTALVPYLTEGGKAVAKSVGGDLYASLKEKVGSALEKVEAAPDDERRHGALEADIEDLLKDQPELIAQLQALVDKLPKSSIEQTQNFQGDNNIGVQATGGSSVKISR